MVEVRRPTGDAEYPQLVGALQRMADRDNGNKGGRIWLIGDDGQHQNIRGGAVISSNNYPLRVRSNTPNQLQVMHSSGSPDLLRVQDSGVTVGALTATGNVTVTGTLGVTGLTTLNNAQVGGTLNVVGNTTVTVLGVSGTATFQGALVADSSVQLGNAPGDAVTVLGTATFTPLATFTGGLTAVGPLTAQGMVTLGDAAADLITITGAVAINAAPSDPAIVVGSGPTIGVFGTTPVTQRTGGAGTAGATYTATEQGMVNRMYSALRAYGWLT